MFYNPLKRSVDGSTIRTLFSILTISILITSLTSVNTSGRLRTEDDEINFTILHTNDEHSALIPHSPAVDHDPDNEEDPTKGGFARLATAVEEVREEKDEEVLLFNAGDFLGGSAFGWLAPEEGYAPELHLLQEMGYDAAVIGNHEYDYGTEVLARYLMDAGYPEMHEETAILASNTEAPADHPLAEDDLYRDTALFELEDGVTLGTFGLIGKDAVDVAAYTDDVEFPDQHETARNMVERLEEKGADIIVAITHSGVQEDRELARDVDGIDVIVGGHCHTPLYEPVRESDTVIVQADYVVRYLGVLELAYNPESDELRVVNEENDRDYLIPIDNRFEPDQEISDLVHEYQEHLNDLISEKTGNRFEDLKETVARSDFTLYNEPPQQETPLANFITDGMRLVTGNVTGERVDVAVQANGNIRGDLVPGSMPHSEGNISFYEIAETIGLGYGDDGYAGHPMVSFYLTGEEIRRVIELAVLMEELLSDSFFLQFSGVRYEYNPDNAVLFTMPFSDTPIATGRAVTGVDLYTGEGIQPVDEDHEGYTELERGDEELYHVATDRHVLSFLPRFGDMVSRLKVEPKDAQGEVISDEDLDQFIVHRQDGSELKVWETVMEYAASLPEGEDGIPEIPEYYEERSGRINQTWSFPYIWSIYIIIIIAAGGTVLLIRRWKKKKEVDDSKDDDLEDD